VFVSPRRKRRNGELPGFAFIARVRSAEGRGSRRAPAPG
jgi:hypothetical protein